MPFRLSVLYFSLLGTPNTAAGSLLVYGIVCILEKNLATSSRLSPFCFGKTRFSQTHSTSSPAQRTISVHIKYSLQGTQDY